ncbi:VanZ family protein [Flavobacterium okayamense]
MTILSLVSLKGLPSITTLKFKDKIIHFMFYFVFVFLWSIALKGKNIKILKIVLFAILYGIVIEILQSAITLNRQADVFDALANSFGACTAVLFLKFKNNA